MKTTISRQEAMDLFLKYNKGEYRLEHALIMEKVLRGMAEELGFAEEVDYWGVVGLLHDLDYELYPEEHCIKEQEMLRQEGIGEDVIRAVASHGWGKTVDIKPELTMEKVLYLANELTVLIWTAGKRVGSMDKATEELVEEMYQEKGYAATYPHLVIERGCGMLGWSLKEAIRRMLPLMQKQ